MPSLSEYALHRLDHPLADLVAPTVLIGGGWDSDLTSAPQAIGFDFVFCGVTYSTFMPNGRGYVLLSGTLATSNNGQLYDSTADVILAPWWDTIRIADDGFCQYELQGVAPRRRLIVQWDAYGNAVQTAGHNDRFSFQIVLHERLQAVEFRYGAVATTGFPARGGYGASIGVRDGADNWRDYSAHDLRLGGSDIETTDGLEAPGDVPTLAYILEPNVPCPATYDPIPASEFQGINRPDAEPIIRMGRNANYLYAGGHSPPLVNGVLIGDEAMSRVYVVPVSPSADNLLYDVLLSTYVTATMSAAKCVIAGDLAGEASQPGTAIHWQTGTTINRGVQAANTVEWWDIAQVELDRRSRLLRVEVTSLSTYGLLPTALMMYPSAMTSIASGERPSGVIPFAIGQLLSGDAAVHKEALNRCWDSVARVANDREQMVFSFLQSVVTKYSFGTGSAMPTRRIASGPGSLRGQRGAWLDVRVYGQDTVSGGKIVVGEEGGDSVELVFDAPGVYQLRTARMRLGSDYPVFYANAVAAGTLTPIAITISWRPGS